MQCCDSWITFQSYIMCMACFLFNLQIETSRCSAWKHKSVRCYGQSDFLRVNMTVKFL